MKVSVIIPVYKVERYLEECVQSVRKQTYHNIEIILVDDGSPDRCGQMCDEYAVADDRITVIHKENGGLSSARNAGIDICKGKYISFVDSDDYISPIFIEALVTAAQKFDADVIAVNYQPTFWDGESGPQLAQSMEQVTMEAISTDTALRRLFYQKDPTGAQFKLYKRHIFQELRFPNGYLFEDLATTYKTFLASERMAFVRGSLYAYRKRMSGIVRQSFSEKKMVMIPISQQLVCDISLKAPHLLKAAKSRIFAGLFSIYLQVPRENRDQRLRLWQEIRKHRGAVMTDADAMLRAKNRFAAWISFLGMDVSWYLGRKYGQKGLFK